MNAIVRTSAFKTGNSVAVRVPKAFGIRPGDALELCRDNTGFYVRVTTDPDAARARIVELIRRLDEIGPIEGSLDDGRIEFPDRSGLYRP